MRKTSRFFCCAVALFVTALAANSQSDGQKMHELVTAYAAMYRFNGTAFVASKGKVLLSKGYGYRNARDSALNDVNTIYQLGSITKQFTATVILKLAEQKKLSVSDKLTKYFPDYPKGDSITIRHLLTHTSGIYNYTEDEQFMRTAAVKPATIEKMMALFRDKPLNFPAGSKYAYSNSGYALLGYIIQKVTGKPYEQVVHEMIFKPLKMTNSGFDFAALKHPDKATGYTMFTQLAKIPGAIVDSSVSFAAGAIYSTVGDLYKWHQGLQQNKIITAASTAEAYTPFRAKYAYGWTTDTLFNKKTVQHGGGIFGFNTHIARIPADDVVVILLANINVGGLDKISRDLLAVLYSQPYVIPQPKKEIQVEESVLQQYVGEYELIPGFIMKITVDNGNLKVQPTGQRAYELFAESQHEFFLKVVEAKATFVKDADGKVEKMIWSQNGVDQTGKKVK